MNGKIERALHNKSIVYLDSAPIIYFIEEEKSYLAALQEIFLRIDEGILRAFSSYITLIEVLVKPLESKAYALAQNYRDLLVGSPGFSLYPVERSISEKAADLRARYGSNLKTPDAIQVATALSFGAQLFITNDSDLRKIKEIAVVTLPDIS